MTNPVFTNERSTRSLSEFDFVHDPNDKNAKLGTGSFACVKLAKEKKTGKQHAIKIVPSPFLTILTLYRSRWTQRKQQAQIFITSGQR